MTLSEKIILLSITLWLGGIAFMAYTFIVQSRLQAILRALFHKIDRLEKRLTNLPQVSQTTVQPPSPKNKPETMIKIDKNEPLSKYETVTLPDEININFVDR